MGGKPSLADSGRAAGMRAIVCTDVSPCPRLATKEIARPNLPDGHVRVAVHYCGLGIVDMLIMTGKYQVRPPLPFVPGSEIAGIVTEVASDVSGLDVGDRVAGLNYTFVGGMAEEAVLPAALAVEVPQHLPLRTAAAMLVNYATAYYGLRDRGNVLPGERVLVLGAAGGVGLAAVEIAKTMGAHVLAAASTAEKLALARRHGADECLNYATTALKDELKRYGGVDVVLDPVGGGYSEQALRGLRPGGRLLVVGFAAGEIPRIALNLPLLKNCSIAGVFMDSLTRNDPARFVANMQALFALVLQGQLDPLIRELDCFSQSEAALSQLADREMLGKVAMRVTARPEGRVAESYPIPAPHTLAPTGAIFAAP
jgi:NADPH2:quinone reductase